MQGADVSEGKRSQRKIYTERECGRSHGTRRLDAVAGPVVGLRREAERRQRQRGQETPPLGRLEHGEAGVAAHLGEVVSTRGARVAADRFQVLVRVGVAAQQCHVAAQSGAEVDPLVGLAAVPFSPRLCPRPQRAGGRVRRRREE